MSCYGDRPEIPGAYAHNAYRKAESYAEDCSVPSTGNHITIDRGAAGRHSTKHRQRSVPTKEGERERERESARKMASSHSVPGLGVFERSKVATPQNTKHL